jgi:hypothetical protein
VSDYVWLQIIKHALQHYVQREGASEEDLKQERKVVRYYEDRVDSFKARHKIGG